MINVLTKTLNEYGGWISLISLLFSILLALMTGNIKKNIKLILEHKDLDKHRGNIQKSLAKDIQSICQNIRDDKLFDIYIISEIEEIIGLLEQHKKILPLTIRIELSCIQHELKKRQQTLIKNSFAKNYHTSRVL